MLIIDSNIWAYYFDRDAPEHQSVVDELEESLRGNKIAINTVILIEVAHFLVKSLGSVVGRRKLNTFLGFPLTLVDLDHDLAMDAVEILTEHTHRGIGGRDATILATAKVLATNRIMTHDQAFKRVDWVEVIDPVELSTGS